MKMPVACCRSGSKKAEPLTSKDAAAAASCAWHQQAAQLELSRRERESRSTTAAAWSRRTRIRWVRTSDAPRPCRAARRAHDRESSRSTHAMVGAHHDRDFLGQFVRAAASVGAPMAASNFERRRDGRWHLMHNHSGVRWRPTSVSSGLVANCMT